MGLTPSRKRVGLASPTLYVAWHREPALMGARRSLSPGESLEFGRDGSEPLHGVLDDDRVSRHHARLEVGADTVTLSDLESMNGTFVNGERIGSQSLYDSDVVCIGSAVFVYREAVRPGATPRHEVLAGASEPAARLIREVRKAARHTRPLLLTGEQGSGRELVASCIHEASQREGRFVVGGPGDARRAHNGTLFINDATPEDMAEALTDDVRLIGGCGPVPVARDMIFVPPLRTRREDIGLLAEALASRHARAPRRLTPALAEALMLHRWPGNLRQLDRLMRRITREDSAAALAPPPWLQGFLDKA